MTICATRPALDTAIIGIADSATYKVWSYRDGGATKYLFVTPAADVGMGGIRNGLVAEYWFDECRNLLKYSQQFDNAAWSKASGVVVTPNQTTAPDGTMTADTILLPALNKNSGRSVPVAPNTVYTWSIYRKKGPQGTTVTDFIYDITHSRVITGTYKNRALSDTWERHTTTFTTPAGCTTVNLYIGYNSTAYPVEYHAWGAQLEAGSAARTYYPTTDKQLLMDTSRPRKNLLLPNQANCCEDGTTTGFWGYTNGAISASTAQKWQGAYSLKCITPNAAASEGITTNAYPTYGLRPGATYTTSVYLRGDAGGETVKLYLFERTDANGEVGSSNSDTITLTTEWQRVTVSRTFGATGRGAHITVITTTQQAATFYVDGLQLEEGSTATAWEAPPNIGILGSSPGNTTNDPTYTKDGAYFEIDDFIVCPMLLQGTSYTVMVAGSSIVGSELHDLYADRSNVGIPPIKMLIRIADTDKPYTIVRDDDGHASVVTGPDTLGGLPFLLTSVRDGNSLRLYNKSALLGSATDVKGTITTDRTTIGADRYNGATSDYHKGSIYYIAVFTRALTQAEVSRQYNYVKSRLLRERGIALA